MSRNPPTGLLSPLPPTSFAYLSFPSPQILLVTLDRPKQLNCINSAGHQELHHVWTWFDSEPQLRVGIMTGSGRAFCAGADLKEWLNSTSPTSTPRAPLPPSGFGGLSRRKGKKPVIAAVNGLAHGGGCEIIANCDIVLASEGAKFALPEVKRGVAAIAGALPRLTRQVGRVRAMEMALTGRDVSAEEAREWGLVNAVVKEQTPLVPTLTPPASPTETATYTSVVQEAVRWAETICQSSPDSVVASKEGVDLGWEGVGVDEATQRLIDGTWKNLEGGENLKEGVRAFVEKRRPKWRDSKL